MKDADSRLELPAAPRAAGIAREFVRERLSGLANDDTLDCVQLCVSELVTNALDHAVPPYELRVAIDDDRVRVEVEDAGSGEPVVRPVTPSSTRGRGMFIVAHTAASWGVDPSLDGKTVWAEFAATIAPQRSW